MTSRFCPSGSRRHKATSFCRKLSSQHTGSTTVDETYLFKTEKNTADVGIQGIYAGSLKEDNWSQGLSLFRTCHHLFRLNVEVVKKKDSKVTLMMLFIRPLISSQTLYQSNSLSSSVIIGKLKLGFQIFSKKQKKTFASLTKRSVCVRAYIFKF